MLIFEQHDLTTESSSAPPKTPKSLFHTLFYRCFIKNPDFPVFSDTGSTVFKPKNSKSDTGFGISGSIYP